MRILNKNRLAIIVIASAIIAISIAFRSSPETFLNIIRSSPEFFLIEGGQVYDLFTIPHTTAVPHGIQDYRRRVVGATFNESFVVVNAPRNPEALQRVIEEFNASIPVEAPPPLLDDFYVLRYGRTFFRESINVPRDIEFTDDFGIDELADIFGGGRRIDIEELIGGVYAGIDETSFLIKPHTVYGSSYRFTVPSDPTLNGLYNNIPYRMIPPAAREKLGTEFFRDREIDMLFDD